ncbi:FabG-like 3-oxoacyl-(acyl-carrier-protein) reductase [Gordonia phage Ranch]|uniref:Oxidoreductase n=1 Tax=Gordonia phage Ranch TaxID=2599848 RepID=A0A5J6TUM8_9CAUD|nr:FabG-like 3-oxoacyl-(acyl-carrier-protein) reductase [Gordonia phage Ranch]QFG12382.1 oxidoreductase [Gordonia phage Ranch]
MGTYLVLGGKDGGVGKATVDLLTVQGHIVVATDASADVRSTMIMNTIAKQIAESDDLLGVVYCAGVNTLQWLGDMGNDGLKEAANIFAVNSLGFLSMMDALVRECERPLSVVAVSSDAAERPLRTSSAYCASKAALNMLVRVAARELGPKGWRVNAVAPGMLEGTGMSNHMDTQIPLVRGWSLKEAMEYEKSQEVVPGRIPPREVAEVVFDLLTGPKHMNGEIITLNGGR